MKMNVVFESEQIRNTYLSGEKKFEWDYGNSGIDLRCAEEFVTLNPGETKVISSGIRLQLVKEDDLVEWLIRPRSGMSAKGVLCHYGTIDHSYTGIGKVCLTNLTNAPVNIEFGDRIAQIVVQRIEKPKIEFVDMLSETDRGAKSFGSSGIK